MMFNTFCKKIAVDTLVYPWNAGLTCSNCSQQFTVTRRKKFCVSCKSSFCTDCVTRKQNKTLNCRKCFVLTARPIDRDELFNLKSRDLVDYLSSRHISTSHCIEKEDLVNAVIRSVNAPPRRSGSGSFPTSPRSTPSSHPPSTSRSQDDVRREDGIRVTGAQSNLESSPESPTPAFIVVHAEDCVPESFAPEPTPSTTPPSSEPEPPPTKRLEISDITTEQDLENLHVRQLKELLAYNRIDYSGCVEKAELMSKCQRLFSDYNDRRKDIAGLDQNDLCKICMDAPIECVLLECGHVASCLHCGIQLSECPICRQYVVRCVRTFKA